MFFQRAASPFFKKYRIDQSEPLGDGTYSVCLRCRDNETGKEYAVKVVNAAHDVANEIESLRVCQDNQNIVTLIENLEDENYKYIVLEILRGGELFSEIRQRKQFSESKAKTYFKQLVNAVKFMHSKKIIHRDLKPENIMFMKNADQLKIVDFGFACRKSSKEMLPRFTLDYASPESFSKGTVDESQDIWSLGAILYTMLCGNSPFTPLEYSEHLDEKQRKKLQMDKILKGNFNKSGVNWDRLSPEVTELIKNMLCVKAKDRMSIEQISSHKWLSEPKTNNHMEIPLHSSLNNIDIGQVSRNSRIHHRIGNHDQNGDADQTRKQDKSYVSPWLKSEINNEDYETLDLSLPNQKSKVIATVDTNHCTNNHEVVEPISKASRAVRKPTEIIKESHTRSGAKFEKVEAKEVKRRGRKRRISPKKENTESKKRKISDSENNFTGFSTSENDYLVRLTKWEYCLNYTEPIKNGLSEDAETNGELTHEETPVLIEHSENHIHQNGFVEKPSRKPKHLTTADQNPKVMNENLISHPRIDRFLMLAEKNAKRPSLIQLRNTATIKLPRGVHLIQNQKRSTRSKKSMK